MFTDYYEVLEVSPKANSDTIERVFRHLAKRYHPDNRDTGNSIRFTQIIEAHAALKDPVRRAQYDIQHQNNAGVRTRLTDEANDTRGMEWDVVIQGRLLSLLYVNRRRDVKEPGIGAAELERLIDCPSEHLEFHLWYLKEKGWIAREENGTLAITIEGVDQCNSKQGSDTKRLTHELRSA